MATTQEWIAGARPRTLPAALAPVIAGTGVAAFHGTGLADTWSGGVVWWKAGLALIVSLALQAGVNYSNDYSDGIRGTDDERVGPMRLVGSGAATSRAVLTAAGSAFGVAAAAGIILAASTNWWLLAIGAASIVAAWFYTGGKRPYGYLALGEVMVFVFFGLVAVVGTTYVQIESTPEEAWYAGIGVGALACAILVVNNLRDIEGDRVVGKRTLAVALGQARTRGLYALLVLAAAVAVVALAAATTWSALIGLAFLIPAGKPVRTVLKGAEGKDLIPVLQQTGIMEIVWAVLVAGALFAA